MSIISKKICLIGDFNVGKTSLVRRFVEDKFSDQYLTTIGVKISRKSIILETKKQQINLLIWDIEGRTKEKEIPQSYLQGAHGAIMVGDLTRINTLKNLTQHLNSFAEINPERKTVVALNKSDLIEGVKLNKLEELYSFKATKSVIKSYRTSAKTGDFVNEMFQELALNIL